jgi:hypothetical protein
MDNTQLQEAFKKFLEQNKSILPVKVAGRPKGSKNKPITEVKPEEIADITLTKGQEKAILKQRRKPRQLSDEQKAVMLKNLEAGRQRLKEMKEAGQVITKKKAPEPVKKDVIPVKVKQVKKQAKKVPLKHDSDDSSDESEEEVMHEQPTESETEPEVRRVRKRVEKKKQVLEEINKTLEALPPKPQNRYSQLLSQRW